MDFEDFLLPAPTVKCDSWQIGSQIKADIPEYGIAMIWVSDFRGGGYGADTMDFMSVRKQFYRLSRLDFALPICDLGDLISGKTVEDTQYILQEIISVCVSKKTVPVIIGGSPDLAYSIINAVNFHKKNLNFVQVSNRISIENEGDSVNEANYLSKLLSSKSVFIKNFALLGYQKHLNDPEPLKLIREVDFDVVRLADMMNSTVRTEPYFRNADVAAINCDAVESFSEPFSLHPQVNGLNRREICAYMKECGLSENLLAAGIFNYNFDSESLLNSQLLAQMIWHLVEGINIRKTHPVEKNFETFWVMIDDKEYAFQRDIFSDLWYFGDSEKIEELLPCSLVDYEDAKRGILGSRLIKFLN